tara:strand:- start:22073 stop:22621 length:549 start_codon:yes stop_codon:yes gene_type:complete
MFLRGLLIICGLFIWSFANAQFGDKWKKFPHSDTLTTDEIKPTSIDTVLHQNPSTVIIPGSFTFEANQQIMEADEALTEYTKKAPLIPGYTILIFSTSGANSKLNARNKQISFNQKFPETTTHLAWKSPNYEVRVGDFRTKLEAEKLLQEIKSDFPSAFVRKDKIELPPLLQDLQPESTIKQ